MKAKLNIITIFLVLLGLSARAQFLITTSSWHPTVPVSAISEAGLDYGSTYIIESVANQTSIDMSIGGQNNLYQLSIQKEDANWNNNLVLSVKRTSHLNVSGGNGNGNSNAGGNGNGNAGGNGNGNGNSSISISGGLTYQIITNSPTSLVQATGDFTSLLLQYKLSGLSVLIPVDTYSTTIVYTLIDI